MKLGWEAGVSFRLPLAFWPSDTTLIKLTRNVFYFPNADALCPGIESPLPLRQSLITLCVWGGRVRCKCLLSCYMQCWKTVSEHLPPCMPIVCSKVRVCFNTTVYKAFFLHTALREGLTPPLTALEGPSGSAPWKG